MCAKSVSSVISVASISCGYSLKGPQFNIRGGGGQGYWDGPIFFLNIIQFMIIYFQLYGYKLFISTTFTDFHKLPMYCFNNAI